LSRTAVRVAPNSQDTGGEATQLPATSSPLCNSPGNLKDAVEVPRCAEGASRGMTTPMGIVVETCGKDAFLMIRV